MIAATYGTTPPSDRVDGIEIAPLLRAEGCALPDARELLAWWTSLPLGGSIAPDWRDVDPIALRRWMGWICLYDVIDGGRDLRYRLIGTRIAEQAGVDLTGRLVSQGVYATTPSVLLEHFRRLAEHPRPTWTKRVMETPQGFAVTHDRIWLPFRRGGDDVVMWLLYLCRLAPGTDRLDVARLAGVSRHEETGLVPVALNTPDKLRR